jgi:hypothetical protein
MKQGLIGGGMSEEVASLLVDMQLAVNEGKFTEGVERTSESATATQLEALLDAAL